MSYRLGVDVGGTFTDLLLIDESSSKTFRVKTPSTPGDQSEGVLTGMEKICQTAGISLDKLTSLMHGTTVATNAVLEGKGAKVGLIVTDGYRQVLQIGRSFVPGGLAGWIIWQKPGSARDAGEHRRGDGAHRRARRSRAQARRSERQPRAEGRLPPRASRRSPSR